jgi:hypothetical protein
VPERRPLRADNVAAIPIAPPPPAPRPRRPESTKFPETRAEAFYVLRSAPALLQRRPRLEPKRVGSLASYGLTEAGRALIDLTYEAVEVRPFTAAGYLDELYGEDGAAELLAATQAAILREAVARTLANLPQGAAISRILPSFSVSVSNKRDGRRLTHRSFEVVPGMTQASATARMLAITGEREGEGLASDYAEYVADTYVLPGPAALYFVEAVVGGAGAGARRKDVVVYPSGIAITTGRDVVEGYCLAYAALALTGYKPPARAGKPGAPPRVPQVRTWVASLGLTLVEGERGKGLTLEAVGVLEREIGVALTVVDTAGEILRHGAPDLPHPPRALGVAIGYDGERCHYGVVHFLPSDPEQPGTMLAADAAKLPGAPKDAAKAKGKKKRATVYYDLETVCSAGGACIPYAAAAYVVLDEDAAEALPDSLEGWRAATASGRAFYEAAGDPSRTRNPLSSMCGWLSGHELLKDRHVTVSAYNGSRFDHLLLLDEAQRAGAIATHGAALHMKGSAVLALAAFGGKSHDPANFSGGQTLKKACEEYRLKRKKVDGFEHAIPQAAYEAGGLSNWIQANAADLELYNAFDVLALAELGGAMGSALREISRDVCGKPIDYRDCTTAPSFAMKIQRAVWKRDGVTQPDRMATLERDRWARRAMTAGRVQNLAGKPDESAPVALEMLDITSSYPHVMMGEEFPMGAYAETPHEVPGRLGIYNIAIISQPPLTILPRRTEGAPLDWTYTGRQVAVATSVDIEEIRRHGGQVEVLDGIYWPTSSRELFRGYIGPLYQIKAAEDAKPAAQRNNARREGVKLLMNSISGKVGQRPHYTITELVQSTADFLKVCDMVEPGTLSYTMLTRAPLISGRLSEEAAEAAFLKRGACAPLAAFIYSYARRNLYVGLQYSGGVGGLGYCDTDSALMTWEAAQRMRQERPELFTEPGATKALGSWDAELGQDGAKLFKAYRIAPKQYAVLQVNADGSAYKTTKIDDKGNPYEAYGKCKIRVKGVGSKSVYLPPEKIKQVAGMSHAQRAAYAAENSKKVITDPGTAADVFHEWAAGRATAWLCLQGRRLIGGEGEEAGAGVRFDHIVKTLKAPEPL